MRFIKNSRYETLTSTPTTECRSVMEEKEAKSKIKVCVIGAGAAGLCAARYLAREPDKFEFEVFEKTGDLGGTWVYTDRVGLDEHGQLIHTSMYKNLRTNTPKELMSFPDFGRQMMGGKGSCVKHEVILDYLKRYAEHFMLIPFIKFHTAVESVKLEKPTFPSKWRIGIRKERTGEISEHIFHTVMICNGHLFDPYIPNIPGLRNYTGNALHCHSYRKPEDFAGKTIILLGGASSGLDIAFELIETASHVYLSHNDASIFNKSIPKISEVPGIVRFENEKFVLKDDSAVSADVLIFCTGYNYSFPFLDESCGISVDENFVAPLYMHMINVEHPTMCFIGIPDRVLPFTIFTVQVQYFLSTLNNRRLLPEKPEMLADAQLKTVKKRQAHVLTDEQWQYNDYLARMGGFQPLPRFYERGFNDWIAHCRFRRAAGYKNYNVIVSNDEETVQIVAPSTD